MAGVVVVVLMMRITSQMPYFITYILWFTQPKGKSVRTREDVKPNRSLIDELASRDKKSQARIEERREKS